MTRHDNYTPFGGRRSEPPTPVLVQRLWRAQKSQSAKVLSCGLYLHPCGIEARCFYGHEDNLLMSHLTKTPDEAKARADEWLASAISRGFELVR